MVSTLGDVLVMGLGRSGQATAKYVAELVILGQAVSVTAVDCADTPTQCEVAARLRGLGVEVLLGVSEVEGTFDLGVASPGIKPRSALMKSAKTACRRVVSEIEFAYSQSDRTWVAITGTNGKTTTTALVAHLLGMAGIPSKTVGNIGTPATACLAEDAANVFVAEVSSFQLALTETFHPRVAVLLNLTPDHIDWHGSLGAYSADKAKVFANMGQGDVAVIDMDDPGSAVFAEPVAERGVSVVRVSRNVLYADGASVVDGRIVLATRGGMIRLARLDDLQIKGEHNVSNALAAAAAAYALGVPAEALTEGLASFKPIEHRLEPVAEIQGVRWFNDSKATNPDAVMKALTAFTGQGLVVLLGGRNKGNDFRPLAQAVARGAKAAVLYGESRHELVRAFEGLGVDTVVVSTLAEAIVSARSLSVRGDAVLLSPACASFDQFSSYEERGHVFKALVTEIGSGRE